MDVHYVMDREGLKIKKIVWVSALILDFHLHKTTQIETLRALTKLKYRTLLVASHSSQKELDDLKGVPTISIPLRYVPFVSPFLYVFTLFLYLPLLVLRIKPDFLVVEPNPTVLSLAPILLLPSSKRPKIILDIRTTPVNTFGIGGYLKAVFFNIAIQTAKLLFQGITIITESMKEEVCGRYHLNPDSVGVWTSGVSTLRFTLDISVRKKVRKELGLEDKFVVFYHGVFSRNRGIVEFVKSAEKLKSEYPQVVLFLLGGGPIDLRRLVQHHTVQNAVVVHDPVKYTDVPKFIALCDVGIVPLPDLDDWRHQCPLNLLEYLSMEKPVIITDIPANRQVLGDCPCGFYISSVDSNQIFDAIVYMYTNRYLLPQWGHLGRTLVEERYSWEKIAESLDHYLTNLP